VACQGGCALLDAGVVSPRDAGSPDAGGVIDAGVTLDASVAFDGDQVSVDSGIDAGGFPDAGIFDAGGVDAGVPDAGSSDAGATDAGFFDEDPMDTGADFDGESPPRQRFSVGCSTGFALLPLLTIALLGRRRHRRPS
jgi:hypothetical protein